MRHQIKIFLILALFAGKAGATTVSVSGNQLMVNCAPFIMRGMNYSPAGIGQGPGSFDWPDDIGVVTQDFIDMQAMGVNTLRVYMNYDALFTGGGDPNDDVLNNTTFNRYTLALNAAQAQGIYVMLNFWLPYGVDHFQSPGREWTKTKFEKLINLFKGHAAVLMWGFGNENNFDFNRAPMTTGALFAYYQEAVSQAKTNQNPPQPFSVILGQGPMDTAGAPAVDVWGLNVYQTTGGLINAIDTFPSAKPLYLSEFGQDSWNRDWNWPNGAADESSQAGYYQNRWNVVMGPRLSALNGAQRLIGGMVFEWNDEWWKYSGGSGWNDQNPGGFGSQNDNDNWSDEEYYGITRAKPIGNTASRQRKSAFTTLQNLWTNTPYNLSTPATCCPACTATPSATPTATQNPCTPAVFDDFDDADLVNNWLGTWGAAQDDLGAYVFASAGGQVGGAATFGFDTIGAGAWSVLYGPMSATSDPAGGGGAGTGIVDLTAYGLITFWVKTNIPGTTYYLRLASTTNIGGGYNWYEAPFVATGAWTQVSLVLDGATFINPGANPNSWATNLANATQWVIAPEAGVTGELEVDGFEMTGGCGVPTATSTTTIFGTMTSTPDPCLGFTLDDFTDGNITNQWNGIWAWQQQDAGGWMSIDAGGQTGNGLSWDFDTTGPQWSVLFAGMNVGSNPAGNGGAGSGARDLSTFGMVEFWVRSTSARSYEFNVASNTNDSFDYNWWGAPFTADPTWKLVQIYLVEGNFAVGGSNTAAFWETMTRATQFVFEPTDAGATTTLQIDGLRMLDWCGLTPPTTTITPTPSASGTASITPTFSATSSVVAASSTPSPTGTPTSTVTLTHTPSITSTNTVTLTATSTVTVTHTRTDTATVTHTITLTSSSTYTPTVTLTFTPPPVGSTLTDTPTITLTSTPTLTFTNTSTWSPTYTSTYTATGTNTPGPSATSSATPSHTPVDTFTSTFTGTSTFTSTSTFTASPTAVLSSPTYTETVTPIPTASPTPQPGAVGLIFEDFEAGTLVNSFIYGDGTNTVFDGVNTATAWRGNNSLEINADTNDTSGGPLYGAGLGFESSITGGAVFDATGSAYLTMYFLTTVNITVVANFHEGNVLPGPDVTNESWESIPTLIPASPTWQRIDFDLSLFSEGMFNPDCTGNCGTTGNNVPDINVVWNVGLLFQPNADTNGLLWIDDISFTGGALPSPTATWTPTQILANTATYTPVPVGSTATHTPTITPIPTMTFTGTTTLTPPPSTATRTATPIVVLNTATATVTTTMIISSPTPTQTPPADGFVGPNTIFQVIAGPNPNPTAIYLMMGEADEVEFKLYTTGMTLIGSNVSTGRMPSGPVYLPLNIPIIDAVSNGVYYLVATPKRKGEAGKHKTAKIMILR